MANQPSSILSNISNGHKSPGSSRISNGSSFEMIPPGTRTPADMSFMNFPVGAPMSISEITAEQALEKVQILMKENHSLREYLKENNAVINNKYEEISEWKERIKKYHKHNQEKCEEAKNLILSLRAENDELKKQLQDTKNSAFHSLTERINQLEKEKKGLEDRLTGTDLSDAKVGGSCQDNQELNEFRKVNEQLVKDKENVQSDNEELTKQNIELSQKLQNVLSDCKAAKAENRQLKQQISQSDSSLGYSFVGVGNETNQLQKAGDEPKDSKQINHLQEMVQKLQLEIHEKNKTLDDYRTRQEQEMSQLTHKHQMELMAKLQNAKEEQSSDIRSLQAQVLSLINEVTESQNKCEAATNTIDQRNARISELEMILKRKQEEFKAALSNYENVLTGERRDHQATKKQMSDLRTSFNQMVADYKDLLNDYENYKKKYSGMSDPEKQKLLNKIGSLTAQVLAAEEAVKYRDEEVKEVKEAMKYHETELRKTKEENRKLQEEVNSTVPVLKAQGEIWQADFHAEREAREKMHNEKEALIQEMNQLQIQNQQLLDELESLSKGQFLEIQKRHAQPQHHYANQLRSRLYVAGPNQPFVYPSQQSASPERGADKVVQYPQQTTQPRRLEENSSPSAGQQTEEDILNCPKCNQVCPDLDSLQIHVLDCIEN